MTFSREDHDLFPGASFVSALDEYTKRIEGLSLQIELTIERVLNSVFLFGVFLPVLVVSSQLFLKLGRTMPELSIFRTGENLTDLAATITLFIVIVFAIYVIYRRLLLVARHRQNLATLLYPYDKLLQRLSSMLEQGKLDEGAATLIELKLLEAEVAYSRAKRLSRRTPLVWLLFPPRTLQDEFTERGRRERWSSKRDD